MTSARPPIFATRQTSEEAPGDRADKAARHIATRAFQGIPQRAFLAGENDHSPILRSLREFTPEVYELLDMIESQGATQLQEQAAVVRDMMDNPVTLEPKSEG